MGTPRVPDSKVVFSTPWLEIHEKDGYMFTHSPKWKGVAVAILPFRILTDTPWGAANPRFEFLAVMEARPCHGGSPAIASITGAYDNSNRYSLEECAMNELREEGGYNVDIHNLIGLDWVNGSKSGDGIDHLFAIEIPVDTKQGEITGDGSAMEANVKPVWITEEQLITSRDMILITMYARFKSLHFAKHRVRTSN